MGVCDEDVANLQEQENSTPAHALGGIKIIIHVFFDAHIEDCALTRTDQTIYYTWQTNVIHGGGILYCSTSF
jgi:hypothetical protein